MDINGAGSRIVLFSIITCCVLSLEEVEQPIEAKLHNYLMKNYNSLVRPSGSGGNGSGLLTVKLGMRLSQLLDVDEKKQVMKTKLWLSQEWFDGRLRWDPKEFGGIDVTHISSEELWRPDIVLYNNADGDFVVTLMTKVTVTYDGNILWEPPAIYKSYCPINVEFFPFDQQECFMKFGSWTYDGHEVDLQHKCAYKTDVITKESGEMVITQGIDLREYYRNVEWDIINVTARRNEKFYPCCNLPYPDIMFNVTLRRRTLFYTINLIMPCIAISALTVLVFYLPSDSGEKITLSISILLALTVFFLLLSDINPPTSIVIPLIGKYLLFTMIVVTLSIFLTVYTLSVHFRSPTTHKMSPWVRRVFTDILPRILCMQRPEFDRIKSKSVVQIGKGKGHREVKPDIPLSTQNWDIASNYEHIRQRIASETQQRRTILPDNITESLRGVKYISEHMKKEDTDKAEVLDWKYVAMVMDRLFLYIFTTACVCGTLGIFLNAPSLYDPRQALDISNFHFNC
ncbi:hypothetical protein ACJMK2_042889 [Sinanodonta woodiana]|uniref:Uncharacterized protein n=2 Tax=Sinanodonta woodiana TaxID=1069815 RepID=A0ABD3VVN6_SINWO